MAVANAIILGELTKFLADSEFFALYPTRESLRRYLKNAATDGDKIRAILRDEYVQRELFPDWRQIQGQPIDPLQHYLKHRRVL